MRWGGGWREGAGEGGGLDVEFFRWEKFVQADHENETAVTGETLSKRTLFNTFLSFKR